MDDISRKIILQVVYQKDQAAAAMKDLASDMEAVTSTTNAATEAINALKVAEQQAKTSTAENRAEISKIALANKQAADEVKKNKAAIQAATGSYYEAQKRLTELGKAIKSAENGFKSTSPAIQKQIKEYNELNAQLKAFDAELGNHQREVGNYEKALTGLEGILDKLIPGFGALSGGIKQVSQVIGFMPSASKKAEGGFTNLAASTSTAAESMTEAGTAAEGAEAGIAGVSGATVGLVVAIIAAIAVIVEFVGWFAKLTPHAESIKATWSGVSAVFRQWMSDLADNTQQTWGEFIDKMGDAYTSAKKLTEQMQDLNRAMIQDTVDDEKADAEIAELQLKMKNRRNTPEQEKAYFDAIQKVATDKYKGNKELADKQFQLVVMQATNARNFSEQERDAILKTGMLIKDEITGTQRMLQAGIETAAYLDKTKGLVNKEGAGSDLKAIAEAQNKQTEAAREYTSVKERAQNRLDANDMRAEAAREREKQQIEELNRARMQAESDRAASAIRTLEFQQESFAKELSQTTEHYRQLLFKHEEFIAKQQAIANNPKSSRRVRAAAQGAIGAENNTIATEKQEEYIAIEKLTVDHNRLMIETVEKGALDVKAIEIAGIEDAQKHELATIENGFAQKLLTYKNQNKIYQESIRQLNEEIKRRELNGETTENSEALQSLKNRLEHYKDLLGQNADAEIAIINQKNKAVDTTNKKYANQNAIIKDQTALLKDRLANGGHEAAAFTAADKKQEQDEIQLVKDEQQQELDQVGITEIQKQQIIADSQLKIDAITASHRKKRMDAEVQYFQLVENTGMAILKNSIANQAQTKEAALNRDKTYELNNQSLTNTQKQIIEEKYRVLQGKAKQKEFENNKKLSIAQALINGAVAVTKALYEDGWPAAIPAIALTVATTGAEVAKISSEQAPAYATGTGPVHVGNGKVSGPGTGTSDSVNARLSNGESVINANSTSMFGPLLSAINQLGGGVAFGGVKPDFSWYTPGFAAGGTYLPTADSGARISSPAIIGGPMRLHPEDINAIASAVSQLPRPVVDVKDVNHQQQILTNVYDRLNY